MAQNMEDRMRPQPGTPGGQQRGGQHRPAGRPSGKSMSARAATAARAGFVTVAEPPKLKIRKPRGLVPWPLILLEGEEFSGKDYQLGELARSGLVGTVYWMSIGERVPDEYDPEAYNLAIVEHDGSWGDILGQIEAVRVVAQAELDAKRPPVVLSINSMTEEWRMQSAMAQDRAALSNYNQAILDADPNAAIVVDRSHWNVANTRHQRLMTMLKGFPGVVVLTARGKVVSATDADGQPLVDNRRRPVKEYKVAAQKDLPFESSAWVRLARGEDPRLIGIRSINPKVALDPAEKNPRSMPGLTLAGLIFDVLGCRVGESPAREVPEATPEDRTAELEQVRGKVWSCAQSLEWNKEKLQDEYRVWVGDEKALIKDANVETLDAFLVEMPAPEGTPAQPS